VPKDPFYVPDAEFRVKLSNYSTLISATPTAFGLSAPQATALAGLYEAFDVAYLLAVDPITRTKGKIAMKNSKRKELRDYARVLAKLIKAFPAITAEQLINLGLNVPSADASPINPPTTAPVMEIASVIGRTARVRLRGADSDRRGKPDGVWAANIYSYVGTSPPSDVSAYKMEGESTRTDFDIEFPATLAPGTQVWISCCWKSPRMMTGPACVPQTLYLGGGLEMAA
jgi:hypothetical protein